MVKFHTIHELKTWPVYFDDVLALRKPFEIRRKDRDFKVDDVLVLREWSPETKAYTGRHVCKRVTFIFDGDDETLKPPPVMKGHCVLGLGHTEEIYDGDYGQYADSQSDAGAERG